MRGAIAPGMRGADRRGGDRGGDQGGEYFASMTDLMLGVLFIFIIMLMAFALNLRQAEHRMSAATRQLTQADLARSDLLHDLAKTLQSVLPVTIDVDDGTLQLGGDILFPKGSADPDPTALPKLRLLAYALDRVLPCYAAAGDGRKPDRCAGRHKGRLDAVYIEGHTDTTPILTPRFQNNWELSAARASETFTELVGAYPALGMLRNDKGESLIGVSGYGESRPLASNTTAQGRQRNRRIELRFIMVPPKTTESGAVAQRLDARRFDAKRLDTEQAR